MKPLKQITDAYRSMYAAGKALNHNPKQLKRWVDAGALVDEDGQVWIKAKGKIRCQ